MARVLRSSPGVTEGDDPRSREYFENDVGKFLSMVGRTTVDVGNIVAGAIGTVTVTVAGARPDAQQTVQVGLPSAVNTGLVVWGNVTAKNVVTVYLYNRTGVAIDPPSAVYAVRVMP